MRREQPLALFTVLGACCTALQWSDEQSRRNIEAQSDVRSCVMRVNSSYSALLRQVVTLKAEVIAAEKGFRNDDDDHIEAPVEKKLGPVNTELAKVTEKLEEPKGKEISFFKMLAPIYNSIIGVFYTLSFLCDLLIAVFETVSQQTGVASSTSPYTALNTSVDCREKFSAAMTSTTEDNFKLAADCIQADMDNCVNKAFLYDQLVTWTSMVQSILNTLMSALEFRHSNTQTKLENHQAKLEVIQSELSDTNNDENIRGMLMKTTVEIQKLQKMLCSGDKYPDSSLCTEDKDLCGGVACEDGQTCVADKCEAQEQLNDDIIPEEIQQLD